MDEQYAALDGGPGPEPHVPPYAYRRPSRYRNIPVYHEDGTVSYLQQIIEEPRHEWHTHKDGMLTGFPRDDRGNYWHPSVGAPTRHVTSKVYRAKTYRPWWQRALMWAAITLVVGATVAAAVPVAGLVCLAHCPVP